jgi:hypothetical protein
MYTTLIKEMKGTVRGDDAGVREDEMHEEEKRRGKRGWRNPKVSLTIQYPFPLSLFLVHFLFVSTPLTFAASLYRHLKSFCTLFLSLAPSPSPSLRRDTQ